MVKNKINDRVTVIICRNFSSRTNIMILLNVRSMIIIRQTKKIYKSFDLNSYLSENRKLRTIVTLIMNLPNNIYLFNNTPRHLTNTLHFLNLEKFLKFRYKNYFLIKHAISA